MTASIAKWAPRVLNPEPAEGKGMSIGDFFMAALELNIKWLEMILNRGELDVNSAYCYGQSSHSGRPDYHMLQSFGSAKNGKVTMQIFEKIDLLGESEVGTILNILKFLVCKGLTLGEVIFDGRNSRFSSEESDYFWFTVLRKIFIYSSDSSKCEAYKTALKNLSKYLEESLLNGFQIERTTQLFLAVEKSDYETVKDLLERYPKHYQFTSYLRAIPGIIFPKDSYRREVIQINPVAIALHKRDIKMLNLLCHYPRYQTPPLGMTRNWKMDVTLCCDIIRDNDDFFDNPDLSNVPFQFHFPTSIESSVLAARLFRACEKNDFNRVYEILNKPTLCSLQTLRNTFISSRSPMIHENEVKDFKNIWINNLYIEKSLVLIAVENQNIELFEYFECKDIDITDLGRAHSKERNSMLLWYLVIKYHLENSNYHFVYNISQKPSIWEGPALVGCLFIAARRKDIPTMELIARYFGSAWFNGPKFNGLTAHGLLVKHGLEKEASILLIILGPQFSTELNKADIELELDKAESFNEFKLLIDSNPHWLSKGFLGHVSLMMIFVTTNKFTLEKIEFLLREREADIRMVSTEQRTMLDYLLEMCYLREHWALRLLQVLQYEEIQEVLLITPNFLSDLSKGIFKASDSVRIILLESFKLVMNLPFQTLETIFFPKRDSRFDKEVVGIFDVIQDDPELFKISSEKAFQLVLKEEKLITSLVHLLIVHLKSINPNLYVDKEKNVLDLFQFFFKRLNEEEAKEETGYNSSLTYWRDTYGMTFLMRLLVESAEKGHNWSSEVDLLITQIIEGKFFDAAYVNTTADLGLGPQFDQQHILGDTSENKKRNTIILKDQIIPVKSIEMLNKETGRYEPFSNDQQTKVMSKEKIKVCENGKERQTRVMITTKKFDGKLQTTANEHPESNDMDEEHYIDNDELCGLDAVSLDNDESENEGSRNGPVLDLEEDGLETRIGKWTLTQDKVKERILSPQHFDKTSVLTNSNETFMTKDNKYKYAQSASTRFIETHTTVEAPNKFYAKKTTLLLLCCRTGKWKIAANILNVYPVDVRYKDAKGSNPLHLAIQANEPEISEKVIDMMDPFTLKTDIDADKKHALKLVTDIIDEGSCSWKFNDLEKKILKKTGQKVNPCRIQQVDVDKRQTQTLRLFRGKSCGFDFECLDPPLWICRGEDCEVMVSMGTDFSMKDQHHYKHTCNTEVMVKHKKKKIYIDQFKFDCQDDSDSDSDEEDATEAWQCVLEDCSSTVKVKESVVLSHEEHSCQTNLQMEIEKDFGILDGYFFRKEIGANGDRSTWFCDSSGCMGESKGCKIQTTGEELKLVYPHISSMHKCNNYTQAAGGEQPAEEPVGDGDDDFGMFGMFE